jgi:multiple sugar transport system ATP-binding protein
MDEPLSNLDAKLRVSMRSHIKHLHHQLGVTTIYVTHDQIEAMTLADRVVVMSKAEIQQIGTPEAIYNDPANLFVAGFIGNPAMNLIEGRLKEGVFEAAGVRVTGFENHSQDNIVLGIRAEDFTVGSNSQANISGEIFSFELTGDATLVTLKPTPNAAQTITARFDKLYRNAIGQTLSLQADARKCYLFDAQTQGRLRLSTLPV